MWRATSSRVGVMPTPDPSQVLTYRDAPDLPHGKASLVVVEDEDHRRFTCCIDNKGFLRTLDRNQRFIPRGRCEIVEVRGLGDA